MKRLKENRHILHVLKSASPKLRKSILTHASPEVIKTLCEISINTLNGNHTITAATKRQLNRYKKVLRNLSSVNRTVPSKRKILIQSGGGAFIPILIGSVLSSILGQIIQGQ